jgi:antirestriction protein
MSTDTITPKIYVACLAAYNNGKLHGSWIEANQEASGIYQAIAEMLQASPIPSAEEWAIHDYEGFGSLRLHEWEAIERVAQWANFITEHGELGCALLAHYSGSVDAARDTLADQYLGCYANVEEYVQEVTEESGIVPEHLAYYINYEAMACDILLNGDVFTITLGSQVHIFQNHQANQGPLLVRGPL